MRICSPQLGLAPRSTLGGEVFDREILLGLAKKGIEIEILLPKGKNHDKGIKNWKVTYFPIPHFPAILYNFFILPYLYKTYRNQPFEYIRIHQPQFIGIGCILFQMINPKIKLIATYHQSLESTFKFLSKTINNRWDHIITDSLAVKNRIQKDYKVPADKITTVHNGVPSYLKPQKKDSAMVKRLKLENKVVLLFMGLFIERKNPLFIIEVLSKLTLTRSDLVVIFWGNGPLQTKIVDKARRLNLTDKIRIQKPIFGKDKVKIHNVADIFVHPAKDEGFALAPLEAMACAKPIVITNAFSAKEAVEDGVNGYLCKADDINQWCENIDTLIKNIKLREKMGLSSLIKVKKEFQWDIAVRKHLEVLQKLEKEK